MPTASGKGCRYVVSDKDTDLLVTPYIERSDDVRGKDEIYQD